MCSGECYIIHHFILIKESFWYIICITMYRSTWASFWRTPGQSLGRSCPRSCFICRTKYKPNLNVYNLNANPQATQVQRLRTFLLSNIYWQKSRNLEPEYYETWEITCLIINLIPPIVARLTIGLKRFYRRTSPLINWDIQRLDSLITRFSEHADTGSCW